MSSGVTEWPVSFFVGQQDSLGFHGSWGAGAGFERHDLATVFDPDQRFDPITRGRVKKIVAHEARTGGPTQYVLLHRAEQEGFITISVRVL